MLAQLSRGSSNATQLCVHKTRLRHILLARNSSPIQSTRHNAVRHFAPFSTTSSDLISLHPNNLEPARRATALRAADRRRNRGLKAGKKLSLETLRHQLASTLEKAETQELENAGKEEVVQRENKIGEKKSTKTEDKSTPAKEKVKVQKENESTAKIPTTTEEKSTPDIESATDRRSSRGFKVGTQSDGHFLETLRHQLARSLEKAETQEVQAAEKEKSKVQRKDRTITKGSITTKDQYTPEKELATEQNVTPKPKSGTPREARKRARGEAAKAARLGRKNSRAVTAGAEDATEIQSEKVGEEASEVGESEAMSFSIRRKVGRPKATVQEEAASKENMRFSSEENHVRKERKLLQKALQEGRLSDDDRRGVLRSLRASLLSKYDASAQNGANAVRGQAIQPRFAKQSTKSTPSRSRVAANKPVAYRPMVLADSGESRRRSSPVDTGPLTAANMPTFIKNDLKTPEIETITADKLHLVPLNTDDLDVPSLNYGLERVLFNPGVYQLQDPRTKVFNFDPYLQSIMPVNEFDFNALQKYVTSSEDTVLISKAASEKKKYTGSTSSMTSMLGHFHFLLSQWREINVGNLSKMFPVEYQTFTAFQRAPISVFLRWRDGVYAIDANKQFDEATILSMLGQSMEKLLTLPTNDFEKYRKGNSDQITPEKRNERNEFHYTTIGDFLMRSQLDAHDPRLPGTGMFDLKTRAVVSVRMDQKQWEASAGYQIRNHRGEWESFEREYYDMIRSAFLKYSLQVRMGRMDGIFVAFHNTERIFGFQYISLEEMDYALHGAPDTRLGDNEFKLSLNLLNRVLDKATERFPGKSLRLHFETRDAVVPFMYIFAEAVEEDRIKKIQETNREQVLQFEREVLGLDPDTDGVEKQTQWERLRAEVEHAMAADQEKIEEEVINVDNMTEEELEEMKGLASSDALEGEQSEETDEVEEVIGEESEEVDEGTEEVEEVEEDPDSTLVEVEAADSDKAATDAAMESDLEAAQDVEYSTDVEDGEMEDVTEAENQETMSTEVEDGKTEEVTGAEESGIVSTEFANGETVEPVEAQESEIISDGVEDGAVEEVDEVEDLETSPEVVDASEQEPVTTDSEPVKTPVEAETTEDVDFVDEDSTLEAAKAAIKGVSYTAANFSAPAKTTTPDKPRKHFPGKDTEVMAMTLTIRNTIDGKYVPQPTADNYPPGAKWEVEYALAEVNDADRAKLLYSACMLRRESTYNKAKFGDTEDEFMSRIRELSQKGREFRDKQKEEDKGKPVKTLDQSLAPKGKSDK